MFKIASVFGATPDPAEELTTLPRPTSREGLLAFGNRSFAPSSLSPFLAPQTKISVLLATQTQNPRTATALDHWISGLFQCQMSNTDCEVTVYNIRLISAGVYINRLVLSSSLRNSSDYVSSCLHRQICLPALSTATGTVWCD